ncbi:MAG: phosphoserine phosphatase SerB, partial [Halovenus sp.]
TVLLGERCGVADQMAEITKRAMNGELAYAESLRQRCALLEGLDDDQAAAAFDAVVLREGAANVIENLNDAGVHTAVLTGGFERGVEAALAKSGVSVDTVVANRLPVEDGQLTGDVEGPLIEGTKDTALKNLVDDLDLDLSETVVVGDGANDLPMLEVAGLAIGFEPKPAVEGACDIVVESMVELQIILEEERVL